MAKLLTIGIPTFNRRKSLALMLERLSKSIIGMEESLEVIISDNCSTDGTSDVISAWIARQPPNLTAKAIRNTTNVGVSRNLVSLLYAASADYFMFLGDDDRLHEEGFAALLELLRNKRPSAVIQATWAGKIRSSRIGSVGVSDALSLFYEFGNAWAGIVDRAAALHAIDGRNLRSKIEQIVWPQSVFGFLAMYDLAPERSIELVDFEIGGPLDGPLNITNKKYWIRSLTDLLRAAEIIQRVTSDTRIRSKLITLTSRGLVGHVRAILLNTLIDRDDATIVPLRGMLGSQFGWRGWLCSQVLRIERSPKTLNFVCRCVYRFTRVDAVPFEVRLERERSTREADIATRISAGKRFGDWF